MSSDSGPNPRVAAGLKATVHNPNVSEQAKESAAQRLRDMGVELESDTLKGGAKGPSGAHELEKDADDAAYEEEAGDSATSSTDRGGETNRVLGGYKATLKNPNVSEGAKTHAEQILKDSGAI